MAQQQLDTIYTRAQAPISLTRIVVTTTGFLGRLIAGTGPLAQTFLVAGLAVTLASAIWRGEGGVSCKFAGAPCYSKKTQRVDCQRNPPEESKDTSLRHWWNRSTGSMQ